MFSGGRNFFGPPRFFWGLWASGEQEHVPPPHFSPAASAGERTTPAPSTLHRLIVSVTIRRPADAGQRPATGQRGARRHQTVMSPLCAGMRPAHDQRERCDRRQAGRPYDRPAPTPATEPGDPVTGRQTGKIDGLALIQRHNPHHNQHAIRLSNQSAPPTMRELRSPPQNTWSSWSPWNHSKQGM